MILAGVDRFMQSIASQSIASDSFQWGVFLLWTKIDCDRLFCAGISCVDMDYIQTRYCIVESTRLDSTQLNSTLLTTVEEMRFPEMSTGWTNAGFLKPVATAARVDRARVLAPPLRPKAEEDAAKMVRRASAVIFMMKEIQE
jgi:hypothetical protein